MFVADEPPDDPPVSFANCFSVRFNSPCAVMYACRSLFWNACCISRAYRDAAADNALISGETEPDDDGAWDGGGDEDGAVEGGAVVEESGELCPPNKSVNASCIVVPYPMFSPNATITPSNCGYDVLPFPTAYSGSTYNSPFATGRVSRFPYMTLFWLCRCCDTTWATAVSVFIFGCICAGPGTDELPGNSRTRNCP